MKDSRSIFMPSKLMHKGSSLVFRKFQQRTSKTNLHNTYNVCLFENLFWFSLAFRNLHSKFDPNYIVSATPKAMSFGVT